MAGAASLISRVCSWSFPCLLGFKRLISVIISPKVGRLRNIETSLFCGMLTRGLGSLGTEGIFSAKFLPTLLKNLLNPLALACGEEVSLPSTIIVEGWVLFIFVRPSV
eukprot:Lithocolla_globosa_v1_NODE_1526_length_2513_cov_5.229361.p2 type:complete len:108 gc:universal NODE_1526_length_2513_cov_5.229361:1127-1450(+)